MHVDDAVAAARASGTLRCLGRFVGAPRSIQTLDDLQAARANSTPISTARRRLRLLDASPAGNQSLTGGEPIGPMNGCRSMEDIWSPASTRKAKWAGWSRSSMGASRRRAQARKLQRAARSADGRHRRQDPGSCSSAARPGNTPACVNPDQAGPTATGVNDFRYANRWGFVPGEGVATATATSALTAAQHRWLDHETALAVGRANDSAASSAAPIGPAKQIQAMPWVRQKAEALIAARHPKTR